MSIAQGFDTPNSKVRHPELDILCARLERIWWGSSAGESKSSGRTVTRLPMFIWHDSGGAVGRKSQGAHGPLAMPYRMEWNCAAVVVSAGMRAATHEWSSTGPGRSDSGASYGMTDYFSTQESADAYLEELVFDGQLAKWEIHDWIEARVIREVREAHHRVSVEIAQSTNTEPRLWLDQLGLETLTGHLMFGVSATAETDEVRGSVDRLIALCLRPQKFHRVDPMRYITSHLRRDAEQMVRKSIGDPRAGSKIRRLTNSLKPQSLEELISAYRKAWPKDEVGVKSIANALLLTPDATAGSVPLEFEMGRL